MTKDVQLNGLVVFGHGDGSSKNLLSTAIRDAIKEVFGEGGVGHYLDFDNDLGKFDRAVERAQEYIDPNSIGQPDPGGRKPLSRQDEYIAVKSIKPPASGRP